MFYDFRQNNSGGSFTTPAIHVIVEADSLALALVRAETEAGIYFNGVDLGMDCECCGDRWYEPWDDGNLEPMVYDKPLAEVTCDTLYVLDKVPYAKVYYVDGRVETYNAVKTDKKDKFGREVYVLETIKTE